MTKKRQIESSKAGAGKREAAVHVRLSRKTVAGLDAIARRNNVTRAAIVAIACARIAESGI